MDVSIFIFRTSHRDYKLRELYKTKFTHKTVWTLQKQQKLWTYSNTINIYIYKIRGINVTLWNLITLAVAFTGGSTGTGSPTLSVMIIF